MQVPHRNAAAVVRTVLLVLGVGWIGACDSEPVAPTSAGNAVPDTPGDPGSGEAPGDEHAAPDAPSKPELPRPDAPRNPDMAARLQTACRERLAALKPPPGVPSVDVLFQQNLEQYFAIWKMPTRPPLSGQVQQAFRDGAMILGGWILLEVERAASRAGHASVEVSDVRTAADLTLPNAVDEYGDAAVYPQLGGDSVFLESADRVAFQQTGRALALLERLCEDETWSPAIQRPYTEEALDEVAQLIGDSALLLFRLTGREARHEFAPTIVPLHFERALADMIDRAHRNANGAGESAPTTPPTDGMFRDVTARSGLDLRHRSSDWISAFRRNSPGFPTFSGGGVAVGDADGDGREDVVICDGRGPRLFRAIGDARYEDVTADAGIGVDGEARMPVLADLDNDGDADLFVTYARDTNRLFRNDGRGRFTDVTESSGLLQEGDISGPCCAVDVDGDALLDLYVGNFGNYLEKASPYLAKDNKNAQGNRLYRNRGDLTFEDVTEAAGVADVGWCQALSHADYDRDGDQDLYVANDFGRNQMLQNRGDGTFDDAGRASRSDDPWHGMNVSFADLNGDLYPEIYVTNIWSWDPVRRRVAEYNVLLSSAPGEDSVRYRSGAVIEPTEDDTGWSWAGLFFDADLDGDPDLYCVNGLNEYMTFSANREHPRRLNTFYPHLFDREPNKYYRNDGGTMVDATEGSGLALADINSRGLALLDANRDGVQDVIVTSFHGPTRMLLGTASGNWLVVRLIGDPGRGCNRDAIGATVIATDGERRQWRMVCGGEGYLSQSSPAIHLGFGSATDVSLEIHWPGGDVQTVTQVPLNGHFVLQQGQESLTPWKVGADNGSSR